MTDTRDNLIRLFDSLPLDEQEALASEFKQRYEEHFKIARARTPELEVIGGYEVNYDSQESLFPLPESTIQLLKSFTHREQIIKHLKELTDDEILWKYRFVQVRLLESGKIMAISANAHVERRIGGFEPIPEDSVLPF